MCNIFISYENVKYEEIQSSTLERSYKNTGIAYQSDDLQLVEPLLEEVERSDQRHDAGHLVDRKLIRRCLQFNIGRFVVVAKCRV